MESRTGTPSADELLAHSSFVRWLAFDLVGNADEAEEVAQETLVRALERPRPVRVSVAAWLAGVTRNVVRMRLRSERRRTRRERVAARPEGLPSAADSAAAMEVLRRLTDAVAGLAEPYRATVLLRYYEGLMPAEIARRTGDPVKTVKTRLHRALAMLRERLDRSSGSRRSWVLLLLPFRPRSRGLIPVVSGAILMTLKTKLALTVVAAAVILTAVAVLPAWNRAPSPSPAPAEATDVATAPAVSEETRPAPADAPRAAESGPTSAPADGTGTVRVRVVDAESGEPLSGVEVLDRRLDASLGLSRGDDDARELWISAALESAPREDRVVTDADGRATRYAPPGPHVLCVRHPRYRDFIGPRFPVTEGGEREFEIRLVPFPVGEREVDFAGVVSDGETTAPLDGVRVTARYREGRSVLEVEAVTGRDGAYALRVPVNTILEIHFAKDGYEDQPVVADPLHLPWIGGDAALRRVDGGPRRGEGRLEGRITDVTTGEPVAGATVTLERGLDADGHGGIGSWGDWTSDGEGGFRIDLRPVPDQDEWVRVIVRRMGYAEFVSDPLPLSPDRTTPVVVALVAERGPAGISGRVLEAETGRPIAGARVVAEDPFSQPLAEAKTDESGAFALPARSDVFRLHVTADGYGEANAEPGTGVEIELVRADARIRGTVLDAGSRGPLAGATVTLFSAPEGFGPGPMSVTDERGRFALTVPPGSYFLRARLEGYGPALSLAFDAVSGAEATMDLALPAADCVVRGTARDAADGRALPRAAEEVRVLRLADEDDEHGRMECQMDAYDGGIGVDVDGAGFSCRLSPGRYLLVVNLRGYFPVRQELSLAAGETLPLDLDLEPVPPLDSTVLGVVRRAGGEAVEGATIQLVHRGLTRGRARTGPDGRFELAAPAGESLLRCVTRERDEPVTTEATVTVTTGGTIEVEIVIGS